MPTKRLPDSAHVDHLKRQAKDLLRDMRQGHMSAHQRVREFHPRFAEIPDARIGDATFTHGDALLTIAREYGYASWPRIRAAIAARDHLDLALSHEERLPDGPFRQAVDMIDAGEADLLRRHLAAHPGLIRERASFEGGNYFTEPSLLEFLPQNPVRQGALPANALEIARILLDAGARQDRPSLDATVVLAASGRICRESGLQGPLLELLCRNGADPSAGMGAALAHGEFAAARRLVACGAPVDLPTAAALGEEGDVAALIDAATDGERQLALSLAACFDRAGVVRALIAAGADPDRYNPPGGHSHCTPLHSAVAANEPATVKALIDAGAALGIRDIHHHMTPLGWAEHLGHGEIAAILREAARMRAD